MPEKHTSAEKYWKTKQTWLKSRGYQLRPRYQPGWTPSWVTDPPADTLFGALEREDYLGMKVRNAFFFILLIILLIIAVGTANNGCHSY
jgi:hypothetical protein